MKKVFIISLALLNSAFTSCDSKFESPLVNFPGVARAVSIAKTNIKKAIGLSQANGAMPSNSNYWAQVSNVNSKTPAITTKKTTSNPSFFGKGFNFLPTGGTAAQNTSLAEVMQSYWTMGKEKMSYVSNIKPSPAALKKVAVNLSYFLTQAMGKQLTKETKNQLKEFVKNYHQDAVDLLTELYQLGWHYNNQLAAPVEG